MPDFVNVHTDGSTFIVDLEGCRYWTKPPVVFSQDGSSSTPPHMILGKDYHFFVRNRCYFFNKLFQVEDDLWIMEGHDFTSARVWPAYQKITREHAARIVVDMGA